MSKESLFKALSRAMEVAGRRSNIVKKALSDKDPKELDYVLKAIQNSEDNLWNSNVPTIRTDSRGLKGILKDGRFKNYLETGHTNGGTGSGTGKHRRDIENANFGNYLSDSERPIYGYMERPYEPEPSVEEIEAKLGSDLVRYGDVKFHPKRDFTRNTSTYTIGDSEFDGGYPLRWGKGDMQSMARRSDVENPKSKMWVHGRAFASDAMDKASSRYADESGRFVELQYHNGVDLSDIESLDIPENMEQEIRDAAIESANKYGFRLNETDLDEIVKRCLANCIDK